MEMRNPALLAALLAAVAALVAAAHLLGRGRRGGYEGGIRAANTRYAKSLPQYAARKRKWRLAMALMEALVVTGLVGGAVSLGRPCETYTEEGDEHKKDIFLCLDVSYSIFAQNDQLVDSLKEFVRGLDGERFGISIFNASSVVYVPMTDDYEYVLAMLDELDGYFDMQVVEMNELYGDPDMAYWLGLGDVELPEPDPELVELYETDQDEWQRRLSEVEAGTLSGSSRGSSLIGEGLATCLYSFPHIDDEDRTRIVILSTDNDPAAWSEDVDLAGAAKLCARHGVTVYGVMPGEADLPGGHAGGYAAAADEFSEACAGTGGRMYVAGSGQMDVADIVADIQRREAVANRQPASRHTIDRPGIPVAIMATGVAGLLAVMVVMKPW